jgi:hypothetical protein
MIGMDKHKSIPQSYICISVNLLFYIYFFISFIILILRIKFWTAEQASVKFLVK